jgi:hypothetical protein
VTPGAAAPHDADRRGFSPRATKDDGRHEPSGFTLDDLPAQLVLDQMVIEWILDQREADAATFLRREQAVPAERWPTMEDVGEQIMRELGKSQLAGSSRRSYSPRFPCADGTGRPPMRTQGAITRAGVKPRKLWSRT